MLPQTSQPDRRAPCEHTYTVLASPGRISLFSNIASVAIRTYWGVGLRTNGLSSLHLNNRGEQPRQEGCCCYWRPRPEKETFPVKHSGRVCLSVGLWYCELLEHISRILRTMCYVCQAAEYKAKRKSFMERWDFILAHFCLLDVPFGSLRGASHRVNARLLKGHNTIYVRMHSTTKLLITWSASQEGSPLYFLPTHHECSTTDDPWAYYWTSKQKVSPLLLLLFLPPKES